MDVSELEAAMKKYTRLLWRVAEGILRGAATTEDVDECVADAFIHCWRNPEQFDPSRGPLKSYLCMVVRGRALNRLQSVRRNAADELSEDMAADCDPADGVLRRCDAERLADALGRLPPGYREVLVRRYIREQKPAEIGAELGLPVRAVENRLYRGKQQLKAILIGGD